MPRTHTSRESILEAGLQLLLRKGLSGSGLTELLEEANVPRGSFYHFFPKGKNEFALAVVDVYADAARDRRVRVLHDPSAAPRERIVAYFDELSGGFAQQDWAYGCLLGNLVGEAVDEFPMLRERIADAFHDWVEDLSQPLEELAANGTRLPTNPHSTARLMVSGWEGAALLMKTERDPTALEEFHRLWFGRLLP